jgi:hypothetical protein
MKVTVENGRFRGECLVRYHPSRRRLTEKAAFSDAHSLA